MSRRGSTSKGWSGSRSATVTSAVTAVAARSARRDVGGQELPRDPAPAPGGCDPDGEDLLGPDPLGRCESAAPTTVVPVTAIVAWRPSRRPAATSRCASDASAGAMTPGARVRPAQVPRRPTRRSTSRRRCRRAASGAGGDAAARRRADPTSRGPARPRSSAARRAGARAPPSRSNASRPPPATRRARSPAFGASTNRSGSGACPYRARLRRPALAPRDGRRVRHLAMRARQPDQAPRSAARPDTRRTRRHRSPASGRRRTGAPPRRRAGPPRPSRSSSPAGARADPRRANRRRAARRSGPARTRRPARGAATGPPPATRPRRSRAASGTLTDVPAAVPSPSSPTPPVPGNRYRPVSWNDRVRTPGSSQWIAWTPSPWWTSRSTYRTRRPSRRARAIASAGSS